MRERTSLRVMQRWECALHGWGLYLLLLQTWGWPLLVCLVRFAVGVTLHMRPGLIVALDLKRKTQQCPKCSSLLRFRSGAPAARRWAPHEQRLAAGAPERLRRRLQRFGSFPVHYPGLILRVSASPDPWKKSSVRYPKAIPHCHIWNAWTQLSSGSQHCKGVGLLPELGLVKHGPEGEQLRTNIRAQKALHPHQNTYVQWSYQRILTRGNIHLTGLHNPSIY